MIIGLVILSSGMMIGNKGKLKINPGVLVKFK